MKTKHFFLILLVCLGFFHVPAQAQLGHFASVHGSLKFRGSGIYGMFPAMLIAMSDAVIFEDDEALSDPVARWLIPTSELDMHIPFWSLSQNGEKLPLGSPRWWSFFYPDQRNNFCFALGYEFSAKFFRFPIGLYAGSDFEWRKINVQTEGVMSGLHSMTLFMPSAGIRIRMLGIAFERRHNWNIVLDCGTYYNLPLKYESFNNWGKDVLGKGFRPRVGLIFSTVNKGSYFIRWEKEMYNMFNQDYTLPDGRKPFEGIGGRFNSIILGFSLFV